MTPREAIDAVLEKWSALYKTTYELDEDGFITIDWGGVHPVVIHAPEDGDGYAFTSALAELPLDKPQEPIFRWLLETNSSETNGSGLAFSLIEDAVYVSRHESIPPGFDGEALKARLVDFQKHAARLSGWLGEVVAGVATGDSEPFTAPPGEPRGSAAKFSSPEELLKANLGQQNMRF